MSMNINVLDVDFSLLYVIDDCSYIRYTEHFRDSGELELRTPFSKEKLGCIIPDEMLLVEDLLYVVKRIKRVGNELYIYAVGIFEDFGDYYTDHTVSGGITASGLITSLASQIHYGAFIDYKVYGISGTLPILEECDPFTDYCSVIKRVARENSLGFRISLNRDEYELSFSVLGENNRTVNNQEGFCVICDEYESYSELETDTDARDFKNIVELVYGKDENGLPLIYCLDRCPYYERPRKIVLSPTGLFFQDEEQRELVLRAYAEKVLAKHRKNQIYRVKLFKSIGVKIGDKCRFISKEAEVEKTCLVIGREVEIIDTCRTERLELEVKDE